MLIIRRLNRKRILDKSAKSLTLTKSTKSFAEVRGLLSFEKLKKRVIKRHNF